MMTMTNTKTTMTMAAASVKPVEREMDSHRAAAFLLLQVKEMATEELVISCSASSKQPSHMSSQLKTKLKKKKQLKKKKTPPPEAPTTTDNKTTPVEVVTVTNATASLPCSPLLRPLPQKPQLPPSISFNFLLTPQVVPAAVAPITSTKLTPQVTGPGPLQQPAQQQQWLLPRRTISLGSSSENLPGLLLNAIKREQQEQQQAKLLANTNKTRCAESPNDDMIMLMSNSSISSLSTSSHDSISSFLSLPPAALVSPTADRQAVAHMNTLSSSSTTTMLPTMPLEGEGGDHEVTNDTTTVVNNMDHVPPCSSSTTTTSPTTSTTTVLRRKFSWKTHPVLEQYLLDHRLEYLAYSAKLNYTAEQKRYNNALTTNLVTLAAHHGLMFDAEHFTFAAIRDRIRCFYKSHVQAAKKKKRKQQQQVNDNNNDSPTSSPKRKKIKNNETTTTTDHTSVMLLAPEDDNDKDQEVDHILGTAV